MTMKACIAVIPSADLEKSLRFWVEGTLESWLWDSANILRGSIDSSDFKNYIFGLLFLKRANGVFEEDTENIMQREKIGREEAEHETYFYIPKEARWDAIKKLTENIGVALDKAFAAIEAHSGPNCQSTCATGGCWISGWRK